ncbi:MAG: hypothetical protein WC527_01485 [Candidatus Margulisiibacteriota bacterium]
MAGKITTKVQTPLAGRPGGNPWRALGSRGGINGLAAAATRPMGPVDITGSVKTAIAAKALRPPEQMFRCWEGATFWAGVPGSDQTDLGWDESAKTNTSLILMFDAKGADDDNKGMFFPKAIEEVKVFSGRNNTLDDAEAMDGFSSKAMYELVQANVVHRLLQANRFGDHFSANDINGLFSVGGYFSWLSILAVLKESDSFGYDMTNLIFGSVEAFGGGLRTFTAADHSKRDKILGILGKFPFFEEEFNAYGALFLKAFILATDSKATQTMRAMTRHATEQLGKHRKDLLSTPFDCLGVVAKEELDAELLANEKARALFVDADAEILELREEVKEEDIKTLDITPKQKACLNRILITRDMKGWGTLVKESACFFANTIPQAFSCQSSWFLARPLGMDGPIPHAIEHMFADTGVVSVGRKVAADPSEALVVGDNRPAEGRADITDLVMPVVKQILKCADTFAHEMAQMTIIQGSPDNAESKNAIKDCLHGSNITLTEFTYSSPPDVDPRRNFPTGIEHVTFFSGQDNTAVGETGVRDFSFYVMVKMIQIRLLKRLLHANKHQNCFSQQDINTILRRDCYFYWLSYLYILNTIGNYVVDEHVHSGLALATFLVGNDRFDKRAATAAEADQVGGILGKCPVLADEFKQLSKIFFEHCIDPPKGKDGNEKRMESLGFAVMYCLDKFLAARDNPDSPDDCNGHWNDWSQTLRAQFEVLMRNAHDFVRKAKTRVNIGQDWLLSVRNIDALPEISLPAAAAVQSVAGAVGANTAISQPVLNGDEILRVLLSGYNQSDNQALFDLSFEALNALGDFGGSPKLWVLPEIAALRVTPPEEIPSATSSATTLLGEKLAAAAAEKEKQETGDLSKIKYAARAGLLSSRLEGDSFADEVESGAKSRDDQEAFRCAKTMLSPKYYKRVCQLPKNDPETTFEIIRAIFAGNLRTISAALSAALTRGQRPIGLVDALLDFAGDVFDGKTMAVSHYKAAGAEQDVPIERKYDVAILDGISPATLATALSLELREVNGKVKPSAVRALLAAEKLLDLESRTGYFTSKHANIGNVSENFGRARQILTGHVEARSGNDVVAAASALARLKERDKTLDDVLFDILFNGERKPEELGYRIEGLKALVADRSSGAYEKMLPFIGSARDLEKAVLSAYVLTSAGTGSLITFSAFDINQISQLEITEMLAEARIPTPEKMAKFIIANRPYDGIPGFRKKRVNGLGQSKEAITKIFERTDVLTGVREVIFKALCSGDPVLTAMAVTAATNLREKKKKEEKKPS